MSEKQAVLPDKLPALPPRPFDRYYVIDNFNDPRDRATVYMDAQDACIEREYTMVEKTKKERDEAIRRIAELERESEESLEFRQKEQDQWNALRDQHELEIAELEREIREALSIMNGESILSPVWCKQVHEWTERNAEKEQG